MNGSGRWLEFCARSLMAGGLLAAATPARAGVEAMIVRVTEARCFA
jgi:hypothetical protein